MARRARSPRNQRVLLGVAAVVFVFVAVTGFANLPHTDRPKNWWLLAAVALIGGPLTTVLNGAEYAATARLLGHRVRTVEAVRVAVLSSAANLLPIPGAVVVRAQALRRRGESYRRALWATAVAGLIWAGSAGVLAGGFQIGRSSAGIGLLAAAGGAVLLATAYGLTVHHRGRRDAATATGRLLAVEVAMVAIGAARYLAVLRGLGYSVSPSQALALTLAGIIASAAGVFPGGLGLREGLAAVIAPLVALPAAVGAAGSTVDRLLGLPVLALLALVAGFATDPSESAALTESRAEDS